VGQGTAVLVRTARRSLVYDTGPRYSVDSDAGSRVMVPLLRAMGVDRIDLLVLSHSDTDHVGGAESLLAAYPNTPMLTSLSAKHPLRTEHADHAECRAGQRWTWDGVDFEVLHPGLDERAPPLRPNQVSCVLKIASASMPARHTALLAGDIEQGEEARLVAAWRDRPEMLAAELLLVPHHGSKTSSTRAFLDAVSPRVAVFQHGWHNRFGHPAPGVWGRYVERGIERIQSPACGAYHWEAGEGRCERDLERRYWHHRDDGAAMP
jgi:competence protein ComEC